MALNLANVQTTDTFQTWFTRTNEIISTAFPTTGGTITGSLTISGDATFSGNTTIVSQSTIETEDALLHLASNNEFTDVLDIGFFAHYNDGGPGYSNNHTGFIRDSGTKEYYVFSEYKPGFEPTNDININHASFVLANVHVKKLISNSITTSNTVSAFDVASQNTVTAKTVSATGSISAASFIGDGSQLTNLPGLGAANTVVATDSAVSRELPVLFTGTTSGTLVSANVNTTYTFNPATGVVSANGFAGDGSRLTNLPTAANTVISSDTAANRELVVPFTGITSGTLTTANVNSFFTFNPATGVVSANGFAGDGSRLSNLPTAANTVVASDTSANRELVVPFTGITSGTLTTANVNSFFTFNPATGVVSANGFAGDGSRITNLPTASNTVVGRDTVNRNLRVLFTGQDKNEVLTSANVSAPTDSFTFNPNTGLVSTTSLSATSDVSTATLSVSNTATFNGDVVFNTRLKERVTVSATAASGTVNFNAIDSGVLYYTTAATGNWTLNIRGDATNDLDTIMSTGQSLSVVFLATNGAQNWYQSNTHIDGVYRNVYWQSGSNPVGANNSIESYAMTVIKTAANTFTVLGAKTQFQRTDQN